MDIEPVSPQNVANASLSSARMAVPGHRLRVWNATREVDLAVALQCADTSRARRRGLLGRTQLDPGDGLWIRPCEAIHTARMKFPIDVVFLRRNNSVLGVRENVVPWRISFCLGAYSVLELPAGSIRSTNTCKNDVLVIESA